VSSWLATQKAGADLRRRPGFWDRRKAHVEPSSYLGKDFVDERPQSTHEKDRLRVERHGYGTDSRNYRRGERIQHFAGHGGRRLHVDCLAQDLVVVDLAISTFGPDRILLDSGWPSSGTPTRSPITEGSCVVDHEREVGYVRLELGPCHRGPSGYCVTSVADRSRSCPDADEKAPRTQLLAKGN
jgi:hypothetical protein